MSESRPSDRRTQDHPHPGYRSHAPGHDARDFQVPILPPRSLAAPTRSCRTLAYIFSRKGFAAISDHLLGRFEHMKGHLSQRGVANAERLNSCHGLPRWTAVRQGWRRPSFHARFKTNDDGSWCLDYSTEASLCYYGPEEPLGDLGRPRGG